VIDQFLLLFALDCRRITYLARKYLCWKISSKRKTQNSYDILYSVGTVLLKKRFTSYKNDLLL